MPKVSVPLSDEVHAAVRVKAFSEGVTLAELGRRFFEGYANGGLAKPPPGLDAGAGHGVQRDAGTTAGRPDTKHPASASSPPGLAAGEAAESDGPGGAVARVAPVAGPSVPPAPAASPAKRCSREARHHINHGGNPCKECGYPKTGEN